MPGSSDCSGFVSWSWGLAAPGETTRTLAPYETTVSTLITVDDLAVGDACAAPPRWPHWPPISNAPHRI